MASTSVFALGLIVNPSARGVRRHYLGRTPFWCTCLPERCIRVTRTLDELERAIAEFQESQVRIVAALGGDGTLHRVVEALLHRYGNADPPAVLALAGGTMNGLARSFGSGGAPGSALRAAVAALEAREIPPVRAQRALRITDVMADRVHYGFGFACGLVYRAFEEYYRDPEPGLVAAVRASLFPIKAVFGGESFVGRRLELLADGAPWLPESPHSVVASVTDNPVLWFRPFGAPLGGAPAFHLAATSLRPRELAPRLWSIFRGRCRHRRLRVGHASDATVWAEAGYLVDGDLYPLHGTGELRLAVGPRLRFVLGSETTADRPVPPPCAIHPQP